MTMSIETDMKALVAPKGKVPSLPIDVNKLIEQANATKHKILPITKELEKLMIEWENALSAAVNGIDKWGMVIAKSDFDLDATDKADAKKIADAKKKFDEWSARQKKVVADHTKEVETVLKDLL